MALPPGFLFSQASLQDYSDCPRRFQLRYLDRLAWPAVESEPALENERHLREGEQFHRLAQQALIGLPPDRLRAQAAGENLERWWAAFESFLGRLAASDPAWKLYPEITLSAPLQTTRLIAKYDLIAVRDGRAVIYDWKTWRKRPRPEVLAARWQTRVYRALLVEAGSHLNGGRPFAPEQIEMLYWLANFPEEPIRLPYDDAQHRRDRDALQRLAGEISAASDFPQTENGARCQLCVYRSYCARGVKAGAGEAEEMDTGPELEYEQIGEIAF